MTLEGMQCFCEDDEVDVVVIGTGAGGAPVMARLAAAGLSVVALEAGRLWRDPEIDFATDEVAQGDLYWLHERLSAGDDPVAFGQNNSGTGVGGSTLHYGAYTPRADRRDLRLWSEFGVGCDWPVTYEELKPYYLEAERFLGISGPSPYPWEADRTYPLPPLQLNASAQLMERGSAKLGIRTAPAPIAAVSRAWEQEGHGLRHACNNRGYCHQGCRNGAKASMDVTYLPIAVKRGAEIRPECFVYGFEQQREQTARRGAQSKITGVLYRRNGEERRQRCRAVYLCAGGIETPRLLLYAGLANESGQVGRNFMAHVAPQVWATFDEETRPFKGFPASLITEDYIRPVDAHFAGGYLIQSYGAIPGMWGAQIARSTKLFGADLVQRLRQLNHVAGLGVNGDCLPSEGNRVTLSTELDSMGMPKPLITFTRSENETRMVEHGIRVMSKILEAAGGRTLWSMDRSAHTVGTCRMGIDRNAAVVDPWGRSYDVPNLWLADNSIFPSALPANPALTIIACALRSADHFLRSVQ